MGGANCGQEAAEKKKKKKKKKNILTRTLI